MMNQGLYDAMPYMYMALGALSTAVLDSPVKYVPTLLFFAAGTLIFMWRHAGAKKRRQEAVMRSHRHHTG